MSKELIEELRHAGYAAHADLIEAQQSWIASLEQNARDADRMYAELETELAASQAQIKVLREALKETTIALEHRWEVVANRAAPIMEGVIDAAHTKGIQILSLPTDDSALRELLKAERERCAVLCDRKKKEFAEAFKDMADESLGAGQCAAAIRAMGSES